MCSVDVLQVVYVTHRVKTNMQEEWKPIIGYEGIYEISSFGNYRRICVTQGGSVGNRYIRNTGYKRKGLQYKKLRLQVNKIVKNLYVHRVVATSFIPNPDNKPYVNHIDGNITNNYVTNLEWCTQKENVHHALSNNLTKVGEDSTISKLKNKDIIFIRSSKLKLKELSIMYHGSI